MSLNKEVVNINFSQGLDTKTDSKQVSVGKFLTLENTIFDKGGLLQKRNGFGSLTPLPDDSNFYLTTYGGGLTAIGTSLNSYSSGAQAWIKKALITPISLDTSPVVRTPAGIQQIDTALSSSGLICTVSVGTAGGSYSINDSSTGQNIIPVTYLPNCSTPPRVFILGNYFIVLFVQNIASVNYLYYKAIPITNPSNPNAPVSITNSITDNNSSNFDAINVNGSLMIFWNGSDVGGAIRGVVLNQSLALSAAIPFTGKNAQYISLAVDYSTSVASIYVSFIDSSNNGWTLTVSPTLAVLHTFLQFLTTTATTNLTGYVASPGVLTLVLEETNTIGFDSYPSDNLYTLNVTPATSTVTSPTLIIRGLGLASKMFSVGGILYYLANYNSPNQPTYFLLDINGNIILKLAYSNGPKYFYSGGLSNVTVEGTTATFGYLYADLIQAISKSDQNTGNPLPANGIYTQLGGNVAFVTFDTSSITTVESAGSLFLTGGYLEQFDGNSLTEQGFSVWPDFVGVTTSSSGGSLSSQEYFYQAVYAWTDAAGNVNRSAPSIPVSVTTSGSSSTNTINISTLRTTSKKGVVIELYRWSTSNQIYYQVTSITSPLLNDPTVDYVTFVDTQNDSSIIGNSIIYTTGGVVENIGAPATTVTALYNNRLFLVDAEDQNLLWYSKQIIEATPVEMSDLFTLYISPTTGAQGSTGTITALAPMDSNLIIFKANAIYYMTGFGPDNTGANNDFTNPTFIASTVGCANQQSIVFTPNGLMFQSSKGIWLLGRNLETSYIGAPVEQFNSATVLSAVNIPAQNQVRFILDNGVWLMYDYYYNQWGTFTNVPAVASTLFQEQHTYINAYGNVFQETPGVYLDGSIPVLLSFTTSWINLAGLQGFQRFYQMLLLGEYLTPFTLNVNMSFNYSAGIAQSTKVVPDNFVPNYGGDSYWGSGTTWGSGANTGLEGNTNVFEARVFPVVQKCESFQINVSEVYDPSKGVSAGAGLTLSGLALTVGMKKGSRTNKASSSF